jgi:quercetin dioxygenase-like cupin family protein
VPAVADAFRARNRSAAEIRSEGAIGNLFDGIETITHGLRTRILAWPGNGYQTESVHLLTVGPGEQGDRYAYDLAEQALLCRHGTVDVWLRDRWVTLRPGDIAYLPAGVPTQVRAAEDSAGEALLVAQTCPPQLDDYSRTGLYDAEHGTLDEAAALRAAREAVPGAPPEPLDEMSHRSDQPEVRSWNLTAADVAARGALFNVLEGSAFTGIGLPMRLVLWPGAGTRLTGFNYAYCGVGVADRSHRHPVADEFLVMWSGAGELYVEGIGWVAASANDVAMAPAGVLHGHRSSDESGPSMMGGFASPPQLDLLIPTDYYEDGRFTHPAATELTPSEMHASDRGITPGA